MLVSQAAASSSDEIAAATNALITSLYQQLVVILERELDFLVAQKQNAQAAGSSASSTSSDASSSSLSVLDALDFLKQVINYQPPTAETTFATSSAALNFPLTSTTTSSGTPWTPAGGSCFAYDSPFAEGSYIKISWNAQAHCVSGVWLDDSGANVCAKISGGCVAPVIPQ
jgi:hypothetical protein